jgi:hypothetical protein
MEFYIANTLQHLTVVYSCIPVFLGLVQKGCERKIGKVHRAHILVTTHIPVYIHVCWID